MSEVMTIRVDRKTKSKLEKLAKAMDRTKSYVVAEAIRAYIELKRMADCRDQRQRSRRRTQGDFASEKKSGRL